MELEKEVRAAAEALEDLRDRLVEARRIGKVDAGTITRAILLLGEWIGNQTLASSASTAEHAPARQAAPKSGRTV